MHTRAMFDADCLQANKQDVEGAVSGETVRQLLEIDSLCAYL
jgi:hypothetical protein